LFILASVILGLFSGFNNIVNLDFLKQKQGGKSSRMSITSLPKASGSPGGVAMITKDGVAVSSVGCNPPGLHQAQLNTTTSEQHFVAGEICDSSFIANGYIKVWVSGLLPRHERVL